MVKLNVATMGARHNYDVDENQKLWDFCKVMYRDGHAVVPPLSRFSVCGMPIKEPEEKNQTFRDLDIFDGDTLTIIIDKKPFLYFSQGEGDSEEFLQLRYAADKPVSYSQVEEDVKALVGGNVNLFVNDTDLSSACKGDQIDFSQLANDGQQYPSYKCTIRAKKSKSQGDAPAQKAAAQGDVPAQKADAQVGDFPVPGPFTTNRVTPMFAAPDHSLQPTLFVVENWKLNALERKDDDHCVWIRTSGGWALICGDYEMPRWVEQYNNSGCDQDGGKKSNCDQVDDKKSDSEEEEEIDIKVDLPPEIKETRVRRQSSARMQDLKNKFENKEEHTAQSDAKASTMREALERQDDIESLKLSAHVSSRRKKKNQKKDAKPPNRRQTSIQELENRKGHVMEKAMMFETGI